jgi:hypothetical protein
VDTDVHTDMDVDIFERKIVDIGYRIALMFGLSDIDIMSSPLSDKILSFVKIFSGICLKRMADMVFFVHARRYDGTILLRGKYENCGE